MSYTEKFFNLFWTVAVLVLVSLGEVHELLN